MPREIEVKSVLNKTKRRDPWFLDDYTFNPYSSCSFNCLYCYIRGSKYGENLESSLSVKTNAIELLDRQLTNRAKKGQYGIIVLSSATDPYLHVERNYELTRQALECILKHRFPVHIITKSDLVLRDLDVLQEINQVAQLPTDLQWVGKGALITFSFSSLKDEVAAIFEPGAPSPSARLKALQQVSASGFRTGASFMPQLPYISDTSEQLEQAFASFLNAGAHYIFPATLMLFGTDRTSSRKLMLNAVQKHFPELSRKYEKLFQDSEVLPVYYQRAFLLKMNELSRSYGLPSSIRESVNLFPLQ